MVNYKINVYLKHTEMENMYVREFIELVTQDINGNNFEFTVYEDDNVYDLTNKRVTMVVKSDSGTVIQENCQVVDAKRGKATITLPPDMLIENGPYMAEVQIWEGVNSRVTTLPFDYTVRLSLENDESIKADPRFSLLQVALQNVNDADGKSKEALKLSKEAKAICDDLVPKANTAAQNAQEALDRAESVVTQEELAQKVMLDGKDTKFDFIESKITQGWIDNSTYDFNLNNDDFSILFDLKPSNLKETTTLLYMTNGIQIFYSTSTGNIRFGVLGDTVTYTEMGKYMPNKHYIFNVVKTKNTVNVMINNDNYIIDVSKMKGGTTKILIPAAMSGLYNIYKVYNKALESIEQQHNFSVLNNPPSIKELHTTDSTGKTSILKLASDEDHVEMASGRTLREEYMGVLKAMGKEVPSADGSPIEVNNGIKARLISGEIKGQTVKCISKLLKYTHDASTGRTKDVNLQLEKAKYTFSVEVTENVGNNILGFIFKDGARDVYKNIPINGVGFFKNVIDLSTCINNPRLYAIYATESGVSGSNKLVEQVNILYGEVNLITGLVDKGLSSTEAIISNNGQQYPIYHPTELNEDGSKKVISLGGLGDTKDTLEILEDGSGIYTKKIYIDKLFNVVSTWEKTLVGASTTRWYCGLVPAKLDGSILMSSIPISSDIVNDDRVCVGTYGNASALHIRVPNSITTSQQVTEYIKTNYPDEYIAYKLATPIIIHIPKELVPTVRTHKTNILEAGGKVKASSFKVTVPVDKLAEIEARLQALESTTVDVVLNK